MSIDAQSTHQRGEIRIVVLRSLMSHRIEILKKLSQQAHSFYIALQSVDKFCNEELSWLSPTFNLWGPYIQFLERLIILMAKKLDFPNKTISVKEGLDIVEELVGFFTRKLQIIQGKLKVLSQGVEPCIPSILDATSTVIDWLQCQLLKILLISHTIS